MQPPLSSAPGCVGLGDSQAQAVTRPQLSPTRRQTRSQLIVQLFILFINRSVNQAFILYGNTKEGAASASRRGSSRSKRAVLVDVPAPQASVPCIFTRALRSRPLSPCTPHWATREEPHSKLLTRNWAWLALTGRLPLPRLVSFPTGPVCGLPVVCALSLCFPNQSPPQWEARSGLQGCSPFRRGSAPSAVGALPWASCAVLIRRQPPCRKEAPGRRAAGPSARSVRTCPAFTHRSLADVEV